MDNDADGPGPLIAEYRVSRISEMTVSCDSLENLRGPFAGLKPHLVIRT